MAVWAYEPEPSIRETLRFDGEVNQTETVEYRAAFHGGSRAFELAFPLTNAEAIGARAAIEADPLQAWTLPIWTERQTVTVSASDTEITCDVRSAFSVGGQAILWLSPASYEVVTISAVGASSITVEDPISASMSDALLMPVCSAYARRWSGARNGPDGYTLSALFESWDVFDIAPGAEIPLFPNVATRPILGAFCTRLSEASERLEQRAEYHESGFGAVAVSELREVMERLHVAAVHLSGRAEYWAFLQLAFTLRGRDGSFWAPEPGGKVPILSTAGSVYTVPALGINAVNRRVQDDAGNVAQITVSAASGGTQDVTATGLSPDGYLHFLRLYRMDTPEIRIAHLPRVDAVRSEFAVYEVAQ